MYIQLVGKFKANEQQLVFNFPEKLHLCDYSTPAKKRKLYDVNYDDQHQRYSVSLIAISICENVNHTDHFPAIKTFNYSDWKDNSKTRIRIPILASEEVHHRRSTIFYRPDLDLTSSEEEEEVIEVSEEEVEEEEIGLDLERRRKRDLRDEKLNIEVRFINSFCISKIQGTNTKTIEHIFTRLRDYHVPKVSDHFVNLLSYPVKFTKHPLVNDPTRFTISVNIPPQFYFGFSNKAFWIMLGFTQSSLFSAEKTKDRIKYYGFKNLGTGPLKMNGTIQIESSVTTVSTIKAQLDMLNIDIPDDIYIYSETLKSSALQSITFTAMDMACITDVSQYLDYITKSIKKAYKRMNLNAAYLPQMRKHETNESLLFSGNKLTFVPVMTNNTSGIYNFEIEMSATPALIPKVGLASSTVIWKPFQNEWKSNVITTTTDTINVSSRECLVNVPTESTDESGVESFSGNQTISDLIGSQNISLNEGIYREIKTKVTDAILNTTNPASTEQLKKLKNDLTTVLSSQSMDLSLLSDLLLLEKQLEATLQSRPTVVESDEEIDDNENESTLRIALNTAKTKVTTLQTRLTTCNRDTNIALQQRDQKRRDDLETERLKHEETIKTMEQEHVGIVAAVKEDHRLAVETIQTEKGVLEEDLSTRNTTITNLETEKTNLNRELEILKGKVTLDAETIKELKQNLAEAKYNMAQVKGSIFQLKLTHKNEKSDLESDRLSRKKEFDDLTEEKKALEEKINTLAEEIATKNVDIKQLNRDLEKKTYEVSDIAGTIFTLKNDHETALAKCNNDALIAINAKNTELFEKLETAETEHRNEKTRLTTEHQTILNNKVFELNNQITELQNQLEAKSKDTSVPTITILTEDHKTALEALKKEKEKKINELNENAITAAGKIKSLEDLLKRAADDKRELEQAAIDASNQSQTDKETLKTELEEKYNNEIQRINSENKIEKEKLENRYKDKLKEINEQYEEKKKEGENQLLKVQSLTDELSEKQTANDNKGLEIQRLKDTLKLKIEEHTALANQLKEAEDKIKRLSKRATTPPRHQEEVEEEEEEEFRTPGREQQQQQEYLDVTIHQEHQNISQKQFTNMLNVKRHHCKPTQSFPNCATVLLMEGIQTDYIGEKGFCCILGTCTKHQSNIQLSNSNQAFINGNDITKLTLEFIDEHLNTFSPPSDLYTLATFNIESSLF